MKSEYRMDVPSLQLLPFPFSASEPELVHVIQAFSLTLV
jgi:hypothetical protein